MNIYTVALFGHREIGDPFRTERNLIQAVEQLIETKEYVEFLVGREGDFDLLAASVVRRVKERLDFGHTCLTLVMPYIRADYLDNKSSYDVYYDEIDFSAEAADAHFKAAIGIRNREMVDRADLVLCSIEREKGGAWTAVHYAQKQGRKVCNVFKGEMPE